MNADQYLQNILTREVVDTGIFSPVRGVQATIQPSIVQWAGSQLHSVSPSGSFAKGTANRSGTDIDLFISLKPDTTNTLREIYESLAERLRADGYIVRRQNVSLNIHVNGLSVDLVPAKRQDWFSQDHSLYRRRADTWTKTNVQTHIQHVLAGGRLNETRIIKLWRDQKGLDFPSIYLELAVIAALQGWPVFSTLPDRIMRVFEYLRDNLLSARFVDPANTNNVISDELTNTEKQRIAAAASAARIAPYWEHIVV